MWFQPWLPAEPCGSRWWILSYSCSKGRKLACPGDLAEGPGYGKGMIYALRTRILTMQGTHGAGGSVLVPGRAYPRSGSSSWPTLEDDSCTGDTDLQPSFLPLICIPPPVPWLLGYSGSKIFLPCGHPWGRCLFSSLPHLLPKCSLQAHSLIVPLPRDPASSQRQAAMDPHARLPSSGPLSKPLRTNSVHFSLDLSSELQTFHPRAHQAPL